MLTSFRAQAVQGFRCFPSMRETRLQVLVKDNTIEALISNPMGYEFMPQFDGTSSAFQLAFHKMQADDLKSLGEQFSITWPKDKCQLDVNTFNLDCDGTSEISKSDVKSYGVSTTQISETYAEDSYQKRKFRFSLEKDNFYFVSLQFDIKSCEKF